MLPVPFLLDVDPAPLWILHHPFLLLLLLQHLLCAGKHPITHNGEHPVHVFLDKRVALLSNALLAAPTCKLCMHCVRACVFSCLGSMLTP